MKATQLFLSLFLINSTISIFGAADDFDFGGGKRAKKTSQRLAKCEAERKNQRKEIGQMSSDIMGYKDLIARLEKQVEDLNNDNETLRGRLEDCASNGANEELTRQINELRTQNKDLTDDNRDFAMEIENLRKTITDLKTNGDGDCREFKDENGRLKREIAVLEEENGTLVIQITTMTNKMGELEQAAGEANQLNMTIRSMTFDLERVGQNYQNCQGQLNDLAATMAQLEGRVANVTTLQAEIDRLNRTIANRDSSISELTMETETLQVTIDELRNQAREAGALTIIVNKLEADLKNARTFNIELKSQVETLKVSLVSITEESDGQMQGRIAGLTEENDRLLNDINGLRATITELKKSLRVQQHNNGSGGCQVQLSSLKIEINKLSQVNTKLKKEISIIMGKGNEIVDANELMIGNKWENADF